MSNSSSKPRVGLDLESIAPTPRKPTQEGVTNAERNAEAERFTIRHAQAPGIMRRGRKRETGRNVPFTVKLKRETNNEIYGLAEELNCGAIAEVIEMGIELLREAVKDGRITVRR